MLHFNTNRIPVTRNTTHKLLSLFLALVLLAGGALPAYRVDAAAAGLGDDYPEDLKTAERNSVIDPWRFYNRGCTSFVAWRLNSANGITFSNNTGKKDANKNYVQWGNADNWKTTALFLGITVDKTPAVGAVAWWQSGSGHVAWVAAVNGDTVTIEEYNYAGDSGIKGIYNTRTVSVDKVDAFIHIADLVMGDADGDGYMNDTDVFLLAKHLASISEITAAVVQLRLDYNCDGTVDSLDLALMAELLGNAAG